MAPWQRLRMVLFFMLLMPIGLLFLTVALAESDAEGLFVGAEWIQASLKGMKEFALSEAKSIASARL